LEYTEKEFNINKERLKMGNGFNCKDINFIESLTNKIIESQKESNILDEIECYFSSTDDNILCGKTIKIKKYKKVKGLSFQNYSLSDIAYLGLEDEEEKIFDLIKNKFPKLSKDEWSAFTRLVVLLFISMEKDV
jgi:hypothetical protein